MTSSKVLTFDKHRFHSYHQVKNTNGYVSILPTSQPPSIMCYCFVHDGHLLGFNYVEVEFSTKQAANCFEPPSWFGHEVTEDVRFSYGTLARRDGMEIVRQILNSMHFRTIQNAENY